MKSTVLLTTIFAFLCAAYGQHVSDIGTFAVPKNFNQKHDTYVCDDAVILNYSPYLPVTSLNLVKFGFYQQGLLKSGTEFTEKRIPADEGIIQQCFYSGDTITEFFLSYKKGFPKYTCTYAVRKRNCKTLEIFGEQKTLAEYEFSDPAAYQSMRLLKNESGYVFIEMTDTKGIVTFLSDQLEEEQKIELNSSVFNAIKCKVCYFAKANADRSILIGFSDLTLGPLNKVNNKILRLTDSGESFWYETTLKDQESSLASHGSYHYNAKTDELTWTFFARSKEQYGYGTVKWAGDGRIVSNQVVPLGFNDIFKNEPEITDYFKTHKLSTTDLWSRLDYSASIRLMNQENQDYIIIQKPHITYELISATYIIKIDEEGKPEWIKPILSEIRDPLNFTSAKPYFRNGKMNLLIADYSTNSKKNEHVNLSFRKEGGTVSFFNLVLDPKDGSELTNDKYDFTSDAGVQLTNILVDEKNHSAVIELLKGKELIYKKLAL